MNETMTAVAERCLTAAHDGTMDFPEIVGTLMRSGFESYSIDFRRGTATYFAPDGHSVQLPTPKSEAAVAAVFKAELVEQAVREAQAKVPGYTYDGFCSKVKAAGCAGYMVSFLGRRAVYFGRTAETHVEHFPR